MRFSILLLLAPLLSLAVHATPLQKHASKLGVIYPGGMNIGVGGSRQPDYLRKNSPFSSSIEHPRVKQNEQRKWCTPFMGCRNSNFPEDNQNLGAVQNVPKDKNRNRKLEDQRAIAEKNRQAKDKQEDLRKHGKNVEQHIPGSGKDGRQ